MQIKTDRFQLSLLLVLLTGAMVLAGGFEIAVETPTPKDDDPRLKGAVLLVRPFGCHRPSDARLAGTAEGLVNGKRKSMPLEFTKTEEGLFGIRQQWPEEGAWVLALTATYRGQVRSAVVEIEESGKTKSDAAGPKIDDSKVRLYHHALPPQEMETALRALAKR